MIKDALLGDIFRVEQSAVSPWTEVFAPGQFVVYAAVFLDSLNVSREQAAAIRYRLFNIFHAHEVVNLSRSDLSDRFVGYLAGC